MQAELPVAGQGSCAPTKRRQKGAPPPISVFLPVDKQMEEAWQGWPWGMEWRQTPEQEISPAQFLFLLRGTFVLCIL